jgi:NAD(P)-dependent dehydrogenase (short-subunit alcohol dehydrogenase family)/acyl carrier protein
MLAMEMDIESDLGIDSIKRVEILSTLEERMPDLPTVTPDMLGTLKTLGEIVAFLNSSDSPKTKNGDPRNGNQHSGEPSDNKKEDNDSGQIQTTLLSVVSELTGYPEEMLAMEMDIESDLGIDSIKRVEILSTLEERMPDLPTVTPDMLGNLKTLGEIVAFLNDSDSTEQVSSRQYDNEPQECRLENDHSKKQKDIEANTTSIKAISVNSLSRQVISIQDIAPPAPLTESFAGHNTRIYISRDETGLSRLLSKTLENRGLQTAIIDPGKKHPPARFKDAAGLILMAPISAQSAFILAQAAGPGLIQNARNQKTLLATISRIDGAFGFYGQKLCDPLQGALAGLVKTAAKEWEGVTCRAIDIEPDRQPSEQIVQTTADYLFGSLPLDCMEIGLSKKGNITLTLTKAPHYEKKISLTPNDVVVVTGGGRGVTAEAAIALSRKISCRMVLLGRSPAPEPEPRWLMNIEDPAAMKKALLTHEFAGKNVTPKDLEQKYRKLQANREINNTLTRITATGAKAIYFRRDIRDITTLTDLFKKIRREIGPIKGLIHGAGVLEDRLILEKTMEQFQRVFCTKVDGLTALLDVMRDDDLKYLVLFSSVSARFGNKGQVDYAMANEVLNKIAWQQKNIRPNCKVVSINWGPWDGGMVDSTLKREFERMQIPLIPLAEGAASMVTELSTDINGPVEVVIGSSFEPISGEPISEKNVDHENKIPVELTGALNVSEEIPLSLLIKREIDLHQYPILSDHILGGKPVVPLALITEWIGHSALHENPGLVFHGIDTLRLLSGIKLDQKKKIIRLMAGKARRKGNYFEVDVEIRDGQVDGKDVIHSRATALLTDRLPSAPKYQSFKTTPEASSLNGMLPYIYEKVLFHGERLKGIRSILSFSSEGMTARLTSAPEPDHWMSDPLRSQWILDPLVLDCAFQMATIWCHEQLGKRSLPSFAASYRQYREVFPDKGVTAVFKVQKTNSAKVIGDFTFLDSKNNMIAQLNGYEAVMNASLAKAFGHQNAA